MAELDKIFKAAFNYKASDIHVVPDEPFIIRRLGTLIKTKISTLTQEQCEKAILEILTPEQMETLKTELQLDFSYTLKGIGRLRGSAMLHHRGLSATFRLIPEKIPSLSGLGIPAKSIKILDNHQGLVLITGATGQGKTTTLAAMVDHINSTRASHILTIEDPIEFVHPIKKGVVNQRELGKDTLSYHNSLKAALREDPDVIMIGELRDLETMSLAISAAETGHLVLGTLSTTNAPKTIDRIIDSFPPGEQGQIRATLSETLKAVITQKLIQDISGKSMVLAVEVLINSLPVASMIRDSKVFQIPNLMQTGKNLGMCIMDDSIAELVQDEKISIAEASKYIKNQQILSEISKLQES